MQNIVVYLLLIIGIPILISCNGNNDNSNSLDPAVISNPVTADDANASATGPVMQFTENRHHFGDVFEGEIVNYSFTFQNTGDADLIISSANGSCGCTVPSFSKTPIKPGDSGTIDVSFNSEGRHGMQSKTVTVIANTIPNSKVLTISAEVINSKKE